MNDDDRLDLPLASPLAGAVHVRPCPVFGGVRGGGCETPQEKAADAWMQWRIELTEKALFFGHRDPRRPHVTDGREGLGIAKALARLVVNAP